MSSAQHPGVACDSLLVRLGLDGSEFRWLFEEGAGEERDAGRVDDLLAKLAESGRFPRRFAMDWEQPLGSGAWADVFPAKDRHTEQQVAVKVLRRVDASTRERQRFLREAVVLGLFDHPGLPTLLGLGIPRGDAPALAMTRLERDLGSLSTSTVEGIAGAVRHLRDAARACHRAHELGIIHRDIKPANIGEDANGTTVLFDWGMAGFSDDVRMGAGLANVGPAQAAATQDLTLGGVAVGTLGYMAPEVLACEGSDVGSDVYALGATLYSLIAGHAPHLDPGYGPRDLGTMQRAAKEPPTPLDQRAPQVPAGLAAVVARALEREPRHRYSSAADFADDLDRFLSGHPTDAANPSLLEIARHAARRNPVAYALLAMALLGALVSAAAAGRAQADARSAEASLRRWSLRGELLQLKEAALEATGSHPIDAEALRTVLRSADELRPAVKGLEARMLELKSVARPSFASRTARAKRIEQLRSQAIKIQHDSENAEDPEVRRVRTIELKGARDAIEKALEDESDVVWTTDDPVALMALRQTQDDARIARELFDSEIGLIDGRSPDHGLGVRILLDRVDRVDRDTWARSWDRFDAWLQKQDGPFAALEPGIEREPDLLFLGASLATGYPEFAHLTSAAGNASGGEPGVDPQTGIQFVLLPPTPMPINFELEPLRWTPRLLRSGPWARVASQAAEHLHGTVAAWLRTVRVDLDDTMTLGAFFASSHEVTQSQWKRVTGGNPSAYGVGDAQTYYLDSGELINGSHPVESISQVEAVGTMESLGLRLPTWRQWIAMAATHCDPGQRRFLAVETLRSSSNLGDQFCSNLAGAWAKAPWSDGSLVHAPVGSYSASRAGLHDLFGNVRELLVGSTYSNGFTILDEGSGRTVKDLSALTTGAMGGAFNGDFLECFSNVGRFDLDSRQRAMDVGLRPVRAARPIHDSEGEAR